MEWIATGLALTALGVLAVQHWYIRQLEDQIDRDRDGCNEGITDVERRLLDMFDAGMVDRELFDVGMDQLAVEKRIDNADESIRLARRQLATVIARCDELEHQLAQPRVDVAEIVKAAIAPWARTPEPANAPAATGFVQEIDQAAVAHATQQQIFDTYDPFDLAYPPPPAPDDYTPPTLPGVAVDLPTLGGA